MYALGTYFLFVCLFEFFCLGDELIKLTKPTKRMQHVTQANEPRRKLYHYIGRYGEKPSDSAHGHQVWQTVATRVD